jgi:hypothetical protein
VQNGKIAGLHSQKLLTLVAEATAHPRRLKVLPVEQRLKSLPWQLSLNS